MDHELGNKLAILGRSIGIATRDAVNALPYDQRGVKVGAILKKSCPIADAVGERIAIDYMATFASRNDLRFGMVVSPKRGEVEYIGSSTKTVYAIADPVDGTAKVAGLGSDLKNGIYRLGNDGVWGSSIAFTGVTDKIFGDLKVGDFRYASITDGNPRIHSISPDHAYVQFVDGRATAVEMLERDIRGGKRDDLVDLVTSSQKTLRQGAIAMDRFQAFSTPGEMGLELSPEELEVFQKNFKQYLQRVTPVFNKLENRNNGGAFDIWRAYGSAAEVLCGMIGRKGIIEPQVVARIALNDELGNVVPGYALVTAAGGEVVDLNDKPIGEYRLTDDRPDLMAVANPAIKKAIFERLAQD